MAKLLLPLLVAACFLASASALRCYEYKSVTDWNTPDLSGSDAKKVDCVPVNENVTASCWRSHYHILGNHAVQAGCATNPHFCTAPGDIPEVVNSRGDGNHCSICISDFCNGGAGLAPSITLLVASAMAFAKMIY